MRRFSFCFMLALLVAQGRAYGEECCSATRAKLVAAQKQIAGLVEQWKTTEAKLAKGCPDARAEKQAQFIQAAKSCPIGSRMGETIAFVEKALSLARDENCKSKKLLASVAESNTDFAKHLSEVIGTRARLIESLHALAKSTGAAVSPTASFLYDHSKGS